MIFAPVIFLLIWQTNLLILWYLKQLILVARHNTEVGVKPSYCLFKIHAKQRTVSGDMGEGTTQLHFRWLLSLWGFYLVHGVGRHTIVHHQETWMLTFFDDRSTEVKYVSAISFNLHVSKLLITPMKLSMCVWRHCGNSPITQVKRSLKEAQQILNLSDLLVSYQHILYILYGSDPPISTTECYYKFFQSDKNYL